MVKIDSAQFIVARRKKCFCYELKIKTFEF